MAHLAPSRLRAQDNSGNAYSGATLTVYETTTTTPAELYSTAALAAAGGAGDLENPLTADAAGYFPQVFLSETAVVDFQVKTSAGVLLYEDEAVQGVPGSTEGFLQDLGDNGRVRIVGANNVGNLEFGDPTGDDVGGDGRIGGWNGTQAATVEIDAAATDVTGDMTVQGGLDVDGALSFGGYQIDAVLGEGTISGAASTDITLPGGFDGYEIDLLDVRATTGTQPYLTLGFGATPTFFTAYSWAYMLNSSAAIEDEADNQIVLGAIDNPSAAANFIRIRIARCDDEIAVIWDGVVHTTTTLGNISRLTGVGQTLNAASAAPTAIRVGLLGGTLSCQYVIRSRRHLT